VNAFPWWRATIDGAPAEVVHVAPNFMAVSVPPGEHTVQWEFRNPPAQKMGALASLGLLIWWLVRSFGVWLRSWQRR
jgi:uncharacterized membrane protein YfhO